MLLPSESPVVARGSSVQDITVREAEVVQLDGLDVDEADPSELNSRQAAVLRWAADTYLQVCALMTNAAADRHVCPC
jgi:hypothetical protein